VLLTVSPNAYRVTKQRFTPALAAAAAQALAQVLAAAAAQALAQVPAQVLLLHRLGEWSKTSDVAATAMLC
jgi:hypothetical protein